MSDTDEYCGSEETATGDPCQRPAGWGTDRTTGYCRTHEAGGEEPGGRDPKLTQERQERIAQAIESGSSISEASRKNGIHRETFRRWMNRGEEQEEGIYAEFHGRLTRAFGEGEATYRTAIMEIAVKTNDTATLMAMLKQRYPDEWGDVDRGEQSGGVTVNLGEADEFEIDPETLEVLGQD